VKHFIIKWLLSSAENRYITTKETHRSKTWLQEAHTTRPRTKAKDRVLGAKAMINAKIMALRPKPTAIDYNLTNTTNLHMVDSFSICNEALDILRQMYLHKPVHENHCRRHVQIVIATTALKISYNLLAKCDNIYLQKKKQNKKAARAGREQVTGTQKCTKYYAIPLQILHMIYMII